MLTTPTHSLARLSKLLEQLGVQNAQPDSIEQAIASLEVAVHHTVEARKSKDREYEGFERFRTNVEGLVKSKVLALQEKEGQVHRLEMQNALLRGRVKNTTQQAERATQDNTLLKAHIRKLSDKIRFLETTTQLSNTSLEDIQALKEALHEAQAQAHSAQDIHAENLVLIKELAELKKDLADYSGYNIRLHPELKVLLERLSRHGHLAFMAQGFARDYLLEMPMSDIVIYTTRSPASVKRIFTNFEPHHLFSDRFYDPAKQIELVCILDKDLKTIAKKGFVTCNTLMVDAKGRILDPLQTIDDLWSDEIHIVGDLGQHLKQDPSKLFTLLTLCVQLNKALTQDHMQHMVEYAHLACQIPFKQYLNHLEKMFLKGFGLSLFSFIHQIPSGCSLLSAIHPNWEEQFNLNRNLFYFIQDSLHFLDGLSYEEKQSYNDYSILALLMLVPYQQVRWQMDSPSATNYCIKSLTSTFKPMDASETQRLEKALHYWLPLWEERYTQWLYQNQQSSAQEDAKEIGTSTSSLLYGYASQQTTSFEANTGQEASSSNIQNRTYKGSMDHP